MTTSLHIERLVDGTADEISPIALEEWKAAVAATQNVRLASLSEYAVLNPRSGQRISIPAADGDAEVYFARTGEWLPFFFWQRGSVAFNPGNELLDVESSAFSVAKELANHLGATIRSDSGER